MECFHFAVGVWQRGLLNSGLKFHTIHPGGKEVGFLYLLAVNMNEYNRNWLI